MINDPSGWQTLEGEPIGGKKPPVVKVDGELKRQQRNEVQLHFNKFVNTVRLSAFPNGHHTTNKILGDGSKLRMVANNGDMTIYVEVSEGAKVLIGGIGIMFTDYDNLPVEGWTFEVSPTLSIPQPFIISSLGQGKWAVARVSELIGGQTLWSNTKHTEWYSTFKQNSFPNVFFTVDYVATGYVSDWVKADDGRIVFNTNGSVTTLNRSRYVMTGNTAVTLTADVEAVDQPVFRFGPFLIQVVQDNDDGRFLHIYYGKRSVTKNLSKWDLDDVPQDKTFDDFSFAKEDVVVELSGYSLYNTVSVHPDGNKAMVRMQPSGGIYKYALLEFTVGEQDGEATLEYVCTETNYPAYGGGWTVAARYSFFARNGDLVIVNVVYQTVNNRLEDYYEFPKRNILRYDYNEPITGTVNVTYNGFDTPTAISVPSFDRGHSRKYSRLLFYDHVTDVSIRLEEVTTIGTLPTWSSNTINSSATFASPAADPNRPKAVVSHTKNIIVERGTTELYNFPLPELPESARTFSLNANGTKNSPSDPWVWRVQTIGAVPTADQYCSVKHACDPLTNAVVISVIYEETRFYQPYGWPVNEDKFWIFCIDDETVRPLSDVLNDDAPPSRPPVPDEIKLWKDATLNALVSI